MVASTFEPELLDKFILTIASSIQLQVEPIPSEGAVSDIFSMSQKSCLFILSRFRACLKKCFMANGLLDIVLWDVLVLETMARILAIF